MHMSYNPVLTLYIILDFHVPIQGGMGGKKITKVQIGEWNPNNTTEHLTEQTLNSSR